MVWLFNLQGECAKNPIGFGGEMNRLVYYILLMQFRTLEYHLIFWYSFSILKWKNMAVWKHKFLRLLPIHNTR